MAQEKSAPHAETAHGHTHAQDADGDQTTGPLFLAGCLGLVLFLSLSGGAAHADAPAEHGAPVTHESHPLSEVEPKDEDMRQEHEVTLAPSEGEQEPLPVDLLAPPAPAPAPKVVEKPRAAPVAPGLAPSPAPQPASTTSPAAPRPSEPANPSAPAKAPSSASASPVQPVAPAASPVAPAAPSE